MHDLKAQIDLATDRLTKAEVGKAKSEKDAKKLAKSIETSTAAVETTEAELQELQEQIETGTSDSDAVRQMVEKSQDALAESREALAEMKESLDEKVDIMTQFRKREVSSSLAAFTARLELTLRYNYRLSSLESAIRPRSSWTRRSRQSSTGAIASPSLSSTTSTSEFDVSSGGDWLGH